MQAHLGEKGMNAMMAASAFLGGLLAIVLFMVLPTFLTGLIDGVLPLGVWRAAVEGVLKLGLFILYLYLVSRVKDVHRMFRYHGAEHKTIATYEAGSRSPSKTFAAAAGFIPAAAPVSCCW